MPLQKLQFRPGVNREGTTLANEGGWFECDKVRFRSGFPEKIGGWILDVGGAKSTLQPPAGAYWGIARSMWNWTSLAGNNLLGVGTNLKYYIQDGVGGYFYDVTPLRTTITVSVDAFTFANLSYTVICNVPNHGAVTGDFVTISGVTGLPGGISPTALNQEFQITYLNSNQFSILCSQSANANTTTGSATFALQINTGYDVYTVLTGWGAGTWGGAVAGTPTTTLAVALPGTTLTAQLVAAATTLNVVSTTGFAASGSLFVGSGTGTDTGPGSEPEVITYTGITSTSFTGCTRASPQVLTTYSIGANVIANVTTISVASNSNFAPTGTVTIDGESITYGGRGSNTLTGCVRGANGSKPAAHAALAQVVQATSAFAGWGSASATGFTYQLRLWSQSNFGQDLVANVREGGFYYWQYSNGYPRMIPLSTQTVSVTVASPTVFSPTNYLGNGEPVVFSATGTLPTGLNPGQTYYTVYDSTTGIYNLSSTKNLATLVNVTGAGSGLSFTAVSANCPTVGNYVLVSDASRFVLTFGVNDYDSTVQDPMLVRWSDQESYSVWTPSITNQAGSYRLSQGSEIVTAAQTRQEVLVWTDTALYSMQYLGPPYVWGFQILGSNISIAGPNATATVNNITYWMGADKFYMYSGRVETLPSTLRQYVYDNINMQQAYQFFAGTNEGYNEVWWFYCSTTGTFYDGSQGSGTPASPNTRIDRYVVFNHLERTWYYGSLGRTAWLDSPLRSAPMATGYAGGIQYSVGNLIYQETGNDDGTTNPPSPIASYCQSSDFDIGDGHNFGLVSRIIPDVTFDGSNVATPTVTFGVRPRQAPGSNYGSSDNPSVASSVSYANRRTYDVQQFTQYVYVRIRGRQMAFRIASTGLGVAWQLGTPRLDVRPDGRR